MRNLETVCGQVEAVILEEDFEGLGGMDTGHKGKSNPQGTAGAKAQSGSLGFLL